MNNDHEFISQDSCNLFWLFAVWAIMTLDKLDIENLSLDCVEVAIDADVLQIWTIKFPLKELIVGSKVRLHWEN